MQWISGVPGEVAYATLAAQALLVALGDVHVRSVACAPYARWSAPPAARRTSRISPDSRSHTATNSHVSGDTIRTLLQDTATWAVVGLSPDPRRDSHRIASLLQRRGKRVIPVNPNAADVLGERAHATLLDLADDVKVDVVDIFRRPSEAGEHVDEAIAIGARAVWMQLGVIDEAAAQRARDAGLLVVMDRCPAIEWPRLARG